MDGEIKDYVSKTCPWQKIPQNIRQNWIISQKEYDKQVLEYSIKNQLRHSENLAYIRKDKKQYYEELMQYSRQSLMLYPYHLADIFVPGLRVTPFIYYSGMMEAIMQQERSYDSLPNFTAADCVRLLGIGRNEYIDLMNTCRSGRKLFRRRNVKDHLPTKPMKIPIQPWWIVNLGMVTEEDAKSMSPEEKTLIDQIIDNKTNKTPQRADQFDRELLYNLYNKGFLYLDVPINEKDCITVPPLEGFVMNRVLGDYFEKLLYKIFVSIDEQTSVGELAAVLQINFESVRNAVSLYCRLGFARKKNIEFTDKFHPSWNRSPSLKRQGSILSVTDPLLLELDEALAEAGITAEPTLSSTEESQSAIFCSPTRWKRVAFLFDSTLTAFLMMGNLSPGLKNHAVTMFEVGKLSDESLDSLLAELEKISTDDSEGEAQRYFEHALVLRDTIKFLRQNLPSPGLDLIRCESLQSLDNATCSRLLNKNYTLLISMAPLSKEINSISSSAPPHLGPAVPEMNTAWFKMYLYHVTGSGPPSLLLPRGTRLRKLPRMFRSYEKVLLSTWGHDPAPIPIVHLLLAANETLLHSALLIQGLGDTVRVAFPMTADPGSWAHHPAVRKLAKEIDMEHNCGMLTLVQLSGDRSKAAGQLENEVDGLSEIPPGSWAILDCDFGIPLFSASVNQQVCSALFRQKLWETDSLSALVESNDRFSKDFLKFIDSNQEIDQESTIVIPKFDESKSSPTLLPHNPWVFNESGFRLWDGK